MQDLETLITSLLTDNENYRNSDNELIWQIWTMEGYIKNGAINLEDFKNAPSHKSIVRVRAKVQQDNPELKANDFTLAKREQLSQSKSDFGANEKILVSNQIQKNLEELVLNSIHKITFTDLKMYFPNPILFEKMYTQEKVNELKLWNELLSDTYTSNWHNLWLKKYYYA
jgi:hypothetical protein